MDPIIPTGSPKLFRGKMTHILGEECEFIGHTADAIHTRRDPERLRRDDCEDVLISLLGPGGKTKLRHAGEQILHGNSLCIADFSKPIEYIRSRNRDIALMFNRRKLQEHVKGGLSQLAGRMLPRHGIAGLLRSHMRALADEAEHLSAQERATALNAAAEMAYLVLQAELKHGPDAEQFPAGLYAAAQTLIRQRCHEPDLDPASVAAGIGCSRAALYRIFAARGEAIAKSIWSARLEQAHAMLTSAQPYLLVDEIAFRCGFTEVSTFNRMFGRRYNLTPREARHGI
jgi:AraC-like DNA-binding protein